MPKVDNLLVREAQLLTTGANIHHTNALIAMYRGAADNPTTFNHFEEALKEHITKLRSIRAYTQTTRPILP